MDDLEGEILALFGKNDRDKESSSKRRDGNSDYRKRRRGASEFSDDEVNIDDTPSRKSKNRPTSKNDSQLAQNNDESELMDTWGPDLIGDAEDRARLNSLPEIEREKIFAERQEQRDLLWERRELKRKLQEGIQAGTVRIDRNTKKSQYRDEDSDNYTKSYSRTRTRSTKSSAQLSEIRRLRDEKQSKPKYLPTGGAENEDYSDEYGNELSPSRPSGTPRKLNQPKKLSEEPIISLAELNSIRLTRDLLDKWIYTPMFNETVAGCYVRIRNSDQDVDKYCVAEVAKILEKTEPSYMLKRHYVDVRLRVYVDDSSLDVGIDSLSNGEFDSSEYDEFTNNLSNSSSSRMRAPTAKFLARKRKDIEIKNNYALTAKDIDYRVKMFQDIGKKLGNIGHRRAEIHLRLQVAQQENNTEEVERLNKELAKLPKAPTSGPNQQGMPSTNQFVQIGVSDSSRQQSTQQGSTPNNANSTGMGFASKLSARHSRVSEQGFGSSVAMSSPGAGNTQMSAKLGNSPYLLTSIPSANFSNQALSAFDRTKTQITTKPKLTKGFETLMSVPNFDLSFFK